MYSKCDIACYHSSMLCDLRWDSLLLVAIRMHAPLALNTVHPFRACPLYRLIRIKLDLKAWQKSNKLKGEKETSTGTVVVTLTVK